MYIGLNILIAILAHASSHRSIRLRRDTGGTYDVISPFAHYYMSFLCLTV